MFRWDGGGGSMDLGPPSLEFKKKEESFDMVILSILHIFYYGKSYFHSFLKKHTKNNRKSYPIFPSTSITLSNSWTRACYMTIIFNHIITYTCKYCYWLVTFKRKIFLLTLCCQGFFHVRKFESLCKLKCFHMTFF